MARLDSIMGLSLGKKAKRYKAKALLRDPLDSGRVSDSRVDRLHSATNFTDLMW